MLLEVTAADVNLQELTFVTEKIDQTVDCLPDAARRKLVPGEEVLWVGRPHQGFLLRPMDAFLEPVAILWAVVVFWAAISSFSMPPPRGLDIVVFELIGGAFCCLGLYIAAGRFFFDRARRRRTWYAVTSSRALIVQAWPTAKVRTFALEGLSDVRLDEGFDDVGTIRLPGGDQTLFLLMGGVESWPWAAAAAPPTFEKIRNARQVYELICHLRDERQAATALPGTKHAQ